MEPEYEPDPWFCKVGDHWVDGPSYRLHPLDGYFPLHLFTGTGVWACHVCYDDYTGTPEAEEPEYERGDERYAPSDPF